VDLVADRVIAAGTFNLAHLRHTRAEKKLAGGDNHR